MALNPKVLKVKILGQDYVVRSSAGQKYLNEVSAYVNEKMEEIMASGIDDSQQLRIAVLAAMNITDELFSYKKPPFPFCKNSQGPLKQLLEIIGLLQKAASTKIFKIFLNYFPAFYI